MLPMTSAHQNFKLQTSSFRLPNGPRTSVRSNDRSSADSVISHMPRQISLLRTEVRAPICFWNLIIEVSLKVEVWSLKILILLVLLFALPTDAADLSAGPLLHDFPVTLSAGHRTEALGPLYYFEEKENQRAWAIPPLISHMKDAATDIEELDFLYPVVTYDRYGSQHRLQFFQLLSFTGGPKQLEDKHEHFTIFPLYFQQRSSKPENNYTALVPFYGQLKHRLFRDEIFFVMFPIYGQSRKKDVITDNYLYPVFHLRHGDGLRGWQFWPIVGHEHKEVTVVTNRFGDPQTDRKS